MRVVRNCFLVICIGVFLASSMAQKSEPQTAQSEPFKEYISVDLVNVFMTATDKKGHFISDLRQDEITLEENGVPQTISHFENVVGESGGVPMLIAFLVDNSGSMYDEVEGTTKIDIARETGQMLVGEMGSMDRMTVVTFDEKPRWSELTSEKKILDDELHGVRVKFGYTALYDAMLDTLDHLNLEPSRKILVICSDGMDNLSEHKIDEILKKLGEAPELTTIVLGTVAETHKMGFQKVSNVAELGRQNLVKIADATAGYAFFPKSLKEVGQVRELIRNFVRSQYSVSYKPNTPKKDGAYQTVTIHCKRKDVILRYRPGYVAHTAAE